MEKRKLLYIVFKIPISRSWSKAKTRDVLQNVYHNLRMTDEERDSISDVFVKEVVMPWYGENLEIEKICDDGLTDEMKKRMNDNVLFIQDYIKTLRYE